MTRYRNGTRRGQGTLEYVLIFALIAIVLVVAGFLLRKQIQNVASEALAKLDAFIKDPSSNDPLRPGAGDAGAAGAKKASPTKATPAGAPGAAKKDEKKTGVTVNKPVVEEAPPDDRGLVLNRIPYLRQVAFIGGAISFALLLFFVFKPKSA